MRLLLFLILTPSFAFADAVNLNLGDIGNVETSRIIQLIILITILSIAPSILVMTTSFTRIIVVLSFLRTAIGLQQTPPNSVMVGLAMFLTFFIMSPTFEASYNQGVKPLLDKQITEVEALEKTAKPFHDFMITHTREKDIILFLDIAKIENPESAEDIPYKVLIPAFMISELRRAFEIGFLIFIPFLIIDMVVASILMAMGMMMLPPVMISLPFKIIFFVLIDGWYMIAGSLVKSFTG